MDFIHLTLTPSPEGEGIPLLLQEKGLGDEVTLRLRGKGMR